MTTSLGDPVLAKRFWGKVNKSADCWLWKGQPSGLKNPYGRIWIKGAHYYAHRVAFESANGAIPRGMEIDHLCRNTMCVNPQHLQLVTKKENVLRGIGRTAINHRKTHCSKGHLLAYIYGETDRRRCRICCLSRNRKYWAARKRLAGEEKPK